MARDMYLVGVSEDELKPDPKPEGPKTPKGKWDNYWYHYKWHTLGAIAVVVVLAVLIVQMVTKNEPDYTLNIVTEKPLAQPVLNWLKAELEVYGQDLDGDGYVEVRIDNLYMSDSTQSGMAMANAQKLTVHMGAGDALFFAFEPKYYEQYVKNNEKDGFRFFTKLDVADDNLLEDGRVWNWKNGKRTEVVKQFEDLGWDEMCIRDSPQAGHAAVRPQGDAVMGAGRVAKSCILQRALRKCRLFSRRSWLCGIR